MNWPMFHRPVLLMKERISLIVSSPLKHQQCLSRDLLKHLPSANRPRHEPPPPAVVPVPVARPWNDEPVPVVPWTEIGWAQAVFVEMVLFLLFGVGVYMLDMLFTGLGLLGRVLPYTLSGAIGAVAFHVFMSFGQRYLLYQRGWIKLVGALLLGINTTTNLYGIIPMIRSMSGSTLLGSVPDNPALWPDLLIWVNISTWWAAVWTPDTEQIAPWVWVVPSWWLNALVLLVVCVGLAWMAEVLLIRLYRRARLVVQQRPRRRSSRALT
jgi:hypothetical protein